MKPATGTRPQPRAAGQPPLQPDNRLAASPPGAAAAPGFTGTFGGHAAEVPRVRREIAAYLQTCPAAADMVLIASELSANAILHTRSRGGSFRVRCQLAPGAARIEVEDNGGPWRPRQPGDRPHGLDIIAALTGPGGWGTQVTGTGRRIVWARLSW